MNQLMQNILIVKANASGDVLRTTVLLHVLEGNIFWITARYNIPLFPDHYPNLVLIPVEDIPAEILRLRFDIIINLEEDLMIAKYISRIQTKKMVGVWWNKGTLDYSDDSAELFDMSLISKLPVSKADELKSKNCYSYQEIICRVAGKTFSGEPYIVHVDKLLNTASHIKIGIEERVGKRWPNKYWAGYSELKRELFKEKCEIMVFEQRDELRMYMKDIQQCRLIIAGDTLAMHIALGYRIPCIAIFNCTSPNEIFGYGILQKINSPLLEKVFYNTQYLKEATEAVPVDKVLHAVYSELHTNTAHR
jgi:heptosyltransferase-2